MGLTPDEKKLYSQLFKSLDPEGAGVITGEKARATFEKSGLPPSVLGEIWQIADQNNLGFLTQFGFCLAMRLIGYTQAGQHPTASLSDNPGPLPKFINLTMPPPREALQPQSTNNSFMQTQPSSAVPQSANSLNTQQQGPIAPVSVADFQKFSQLFIKTVGSPNGELSGNKAREIFLKAKLPTSTLGHVWSLVDKDNLGKLDQGAFVIAMHLIQGLLSGSISRLPPFLPEYIWTSVKSHDVKSPTNDVRNVLYSSVSSNQTAIRHPPSSLPSNPSVQSRGSTSDSSNDWVITPAMKQQHDAIFDSLDKLKSGRLNPNDVASYLMTSNLSQQDLATIWDLSDIQNTGIFTKLEFSIALFLVNKRINGETLPNIVPKSLLDSINNLLLSEKPEKKVDEAKVKPLEKQKTAIDDLADIFGSTAAPQPGTNSQASSLQRQVSTSDLSADGIPKVRKNFTNSFKPSSSFGQDLMNRRTSQLGPKDTKEHNDLLGEDVPDAKDVPNVKAREAPVEAKNSKNINYDALREVPPPPAKRMDSSNQSLRSPSTIERSVPHTDPSPSAPNGDDLLADTNPEISGQLSAATTDTANLSNQIKSLTSQTFGLHDKKSRAQKELERILGTKKEIENKLAQIKSSYNNEVQQYQQVEKDLTTAKEETEALRSEASISEAKLNQVSTDLNEKQEAVEALQKENGSLKERLGLLNAEIAENQKLLESKTSEYQQLANKVSVNRSQVQVSIVKNEELKRKIEELEQSQQALEAELRKHAETEQNAKSEYKDLTSKIHGLTEKHDLALNKGRGIQAPSGSAKPDFLKNNSLAQDELHQNRSMSPDFNIMPGTIPGNDLVSKGPASGEFQNIDPRTSEKELPANLEDVKDEDELSLKFPKLALGDQKSKSVNNPTAGSSSVTTDNKSLVGNETPITSPSNSDYQFSESAGAGIVGSMVGMPGVPVGVQRTESLTSSVQNNPSLSVRDDNIDDLSDRETIGNVNSSNDSEPVVRGIKGDKSGANANPDEAVDADKVSSGVESFEIVNHEEAKGSDAVQQRQDIFLDSENQSQKPELTEESLKPEDGQFHRNIDQEFPPIRELDYDDSSSDEESHARFDDAVDNLPESSDNNVLNTSSKDFFEDEFSNLEAAKVDNDVADEFEAKSPEMALSEEFTNNPLYDTNVEYGGSSGNNASTQGGDVDEWEQLFAGFGNSQAPTQPQDDAIPAAQHESLSNTVNPLVSDYSDPAVQELVGMGFDEKTSLDALKKEGWNLEAATNYLLDHA